MEESLKDWGTFNPEANDTSPVHFAHCFRLEQCQSLSICIEEWLVARVRIASLRESKRGVHIRLGSTSCM